MGRYAELRDAQADNGPSNSPNRQRNSTQLRNASASGTDISTSLGKPATGRNIVRSGPMWFEQRCRLHKLIRWPLFGSQVVVAPSQTSAWCLVDRFTVHSCPVESFHHVPGSLMVVFLLLTGFNEERRCDLILMGKSEVRPHFFIQANERTSLMSLISRCPSWSLLSFN